MCIPQRRERNSQNNCINSNQILLNDKGQQVHMGAKPAINDCLVVLVIVSRFWTTAVLDF